MIDILPKAHTSSLEKPFEVFIWRDSNLENEVIDQQISAHMSGSTSSPSYSNYLLNRTAFDDRGR